MNIGEIRELQVYFQEIGAIDFNFFSEAELKDLTLQEAKDCIRVSYTKSRRASRFAREIGLIP